jgi:hypothetical protein
MDIRTPNCKPSCLSMLNASGLLVDPAKRIDFVLPSLSSASAYQEEVTKKDATMKSSSRLEPVFNTSARCLQTSKHMPTERYPRTYCLNVIGRDEKKRREKKVNSFSSGYLKTHTRHLSTSYSLLLALSAIIMFSAPVLLSYKPVHLEYLYF